MQLESLRSLYEHELNDLYDVETQLMHVLPRMANAAVSEDLRLALETEGELTHEHVRRLKRVFHLMKDRPHPLEREVRNPILERAERMIEATGDPAIKDVGLISAMQHIEHQMIAGYGCARTYADLMGDENSAELLQESLNDERLTDESLTELSTRLIYAEAVMA